MRRRLVLLSTKSQIKSSILQRYNIQSSNVATLRYPFYSNCNNHFSLRTYSKDSSSSTKNSSSSNSKSTDSTVKKGKTSPSARPRPLLSSSIVQSPRALANTTSSLLKLTSGLDPAPTVPIDDLILEKSLLSSVHRLPGDNLVRCTVFDKNGNVKVVSGEFKRSELLSKNGLLPRDLRKLDTGVSTIVPSILVRQNSILVNLLHIRALIKADMVIIFDAYGSTDSQTQSIFMYDLTHKLRGDDSSVNLPYELRALEAIFISVVTALDAEMQVLTSVVNGILSELETNIDRSKLRHLLVQSKKLSAFLQKATLIRDAIDELLEQDEDLAGLYLTEKQLGLPRDEEGDHSEVEMLLESYYKHCDEIVQTVDNLVSNIRSTEEIINIILDSNRNSLMLLDLKFQIGTLGLGAGAFISALYGMNLKNFIEESQYGFGGVTAVVMLSTFVVILMALRNLRRVRRVTMMKNNSNGSRAAMNNITQSTLAHNGAPIYSAATNTANHTASTTKYKKPKLSFFQRFFKNKSIMSSPNLRRNQLKDTNYSPGSSAYSTFQMSNVSSPLSDSFKYSQPSTKFASSQQNYESASVNNLGNTKIDYNYDDGCSLHSPIPKPKTEKCSLNFYQHYHNFDNIIGNDPKDNEKKVWNWLVKSPKIKY